MKLLYIIPFIAFVVVLYYLISKSNKAGAAEELPKRFAHYQSIDSTATIAGTEVKMKLLQTSMQRIAHFLTVQNDVILYSVPEKNENTFLKINPEGDVADSLTLNAKPEDIVFLKGFIIDKEKQQYYKWSFNGVKMPTKISLQNADFKWDEEKQRKQLDDIAENSEAVCVNYEFDSPTPQKAVANGLQTVQGVNSYAIITYFIGDECFQLYTALNIHQQFSSSYTQEMLWNNLFKRINNKFSYDGEIVKTPDIKYQYFQKQKLEKVRFSGGGGGAPGFSKMLYPGYLFTDVVYKQDTLKLKEFMYLEEEWHTSEIEIDGKNIGALSKNKAQPVKHIKGYMYYTNEKLQYALFSSNDHQIYLIR